ncbi:MAG: sulfide/dihydroorotate dehydrogenase-like FAD/NAD-binding protein [archaeon]
MSRIIEKDRIADNVYLIRVEAPMIAAKAKAGNFVVLRVGDDGERIPLTIADYDRESITLIFLVAGKSTEDLSRLHAGDDITDIAGPLGRPSQIETVGTVVLVGGGVGNAVIYPIARGMKEAGNRTIVIAGSRTRSLVFWEDKLKSASDELIICTDDGSYGVKGLVTDSLKKVMQQEKVSLVYAVGPTIMMKFVSLAAADVPAVVSLNPIMVDGVGMCGGCRVEVGGEVRFACVDGPEFDGHKVNWDDLMNRNQRYTEE